MDVLLTDARIVAPAGVIDGGWLRASGGRIAGLGPGEPGADAADAVQLARRWVVPGFVDLHVHGGGGSSMLSADPDEIAAAAAFHASHGTTRTLASLVSASLDETLAGLAAVRDAARASGAGSGTIVGSHLEGPFINPARAGAHDRRHLRDPDPSTFDRMLEAADGTLRVITLAPELPGGLDLVRRAVDAGVVVALGHSEAGRDVAAAAFDAGATLVTHLFNAMPPIDHRAPGLATTALLRADASCELINDGVHLHDDTSRLAFAAVGPERIALVTDAIPATGLGDGRHRLGPAEIEIRDGVARLAGSTTLAGSTLTMDAAFRRAAMDLGLGAAAASTAASATASRVLGIDEDVGALVAGLAADLVVLDDELRVEAVMIGGEWTRSGRLFDR
ncbi:MAG: N-acetylglucosamine-6-phosphate deacetylase [Chloroflexi bacterium]|nr:N-acetylglucosamine-6-phosphate deacetylase [Chloroflexota bacterium]